MSRACLSAAKENENALSSLHPDSISLHVVTTRECSAGGSILGPVRESSKAWCSVELSNFQYSVCDDAKQSQNIRDFLYMYGSVTTHFHVTGIWPRILLRSANQKSCYP
jgi:hypothetical protein